MPVIRLKTVDLLKTVGASTAGSASAGNAGAGADVGPTVLSLDISFEGLGHMGLEANKLTASLVTKLAPLKPLVLVLKYFLNRRGLLEAFTGGMSSYALLLITARFLQEVEQQQQLHHHQTLSSEAEPPPMDLGALLLATLQFFGESFDPFLTGSHTLS